SSPIRASNSFTFMIAPHETKARPNCSPAFLVGCFVFGFGFERGPPCLRAGSWRPRSLAVPGARGRSSRGADGAAPRERPCTQQHQGTSLVDRGVVGRD